VIAFVLAVSCLAFTAPGATASRAGQPAGHEAASTAQVVRVHGQTLWLTAAAMAQYAYPAPMSTVYLATGRDYPDALAAGAATVGGGPVLLVDRTTVSDAVRRELDRLRPSRIVVVGGTSAVSDAVVAAVRPYADRVDRVAGANRYDTAARLSADSFDPGVPAVYVATGLNFPDGLAGSAAAARAGGPLLLVTKGSVPGETLAEIRRLRPARIVVLGGTAVVSDDVKNALARLAPTVRLAGSHRYGTAAAASRDAGPATTVVLATGTNFPDAVAAGAAAGTWDAPLLLTSPTRLSAETAAELDRLRPSRVVVVGGSSAVSPDVVAAVRSAVGGASYTEHPLRLPTFTASIRTLDAATLARMRYSHRAGCPVSAADLRLVTMPYFGFDADAHTGEMVVHEDHASAATRVFQRIYDARFPVERMVLVDDYYGDDDRSMAANNTSAYNCRTTSSGRWSEHAYGRAIDINPVQNPYVKGDFVAPEAGRPYAWKSRSASATYYRGFIRSSDAVVDAFAAQGWEWGGYWRNSKDYQHFSSTGL
jgi:putative cell wall-binding protein